jgi:hypothetical protein
VTTAFESESVLALNSISSQYWNSPITRTIGVPLSSVFTVIVAAGAQFTAVIAATPAATAIVMSPCRPLQCRSKRTRADVPKILTRVDGRLNTVRWGAVFAASPETGTSKTGRSRRARK